MIKLASILFSTLFLMQSANIHFNDVLEFKELLEHANMHKERYGDNFVVFLSKHYGELKDSHKEQHEQEQKENQNAPIQHHDCTAQIQIDFLFNSFTYSFTVNKFIDSKKTNFYYQDRHSTFEKQKIFQPPQMS
jgi:hypothetical protein